jgi:hypothetical protein
MAADFMDEAVDCVDISTVMWVEFGKVLSLNKYQCAEARDGYQWDGE